LPICLLYRVGRPGTAGAPRSPGSTTVAVLALAAVTWLVSRPAEPLFPQTHLELSTPATTTPTVLAISADGRRVVYSAVEDGRAVLWVRSLDGGAPARLDGTEDGALPFWSPDGRSIAFFKDRALRAIDVASGTIRTLAPVADGLGGSWNSQGDVLFAPSGVGGLQRVSTRDAERAAITELGPGQRSHGSPAFLPNGRDFLFYADGAEGRAVYAGSLEGRQTARVVDADGPAAYASGHILYLRQGRLLAQPFDLEGLAVSGEAISIEGAGGDDGRNVIAAAAAGDVVVYRTEGASGSGRRLAWLDRSGAEVLAVEGGERSGGFALSPDEARIAITRNVGGNSDIWLLDVRRGVPSRFTTAASLESHPLFSADGSRVIYQRFYTDRGIVGLVSRPVAGGEEEVLIEGTRGGIATDVSRDGRLLLFKSVEQINESLDWDIWALPLSGDRQPIAAVTTPADERDGQFSPDAQWLLYQSNESGQFEVYLQPFGRAGERLRVSAAGGGQARWRADGREIFYVGLDGRLMAVAVQPGADSSAAPMLSRPEPLFATSMGPVVPAIARQWYLPSPDGQRFLMSVVDPTNASPLQVILNFQPAAQR
jgi:Tol biopolymer transport system component